MTAVRIDILWKVYPESRSHPPHPAIEELHLGLERGEFVCLVGPSGCGKTTLLNILAGLDRHFQGRVDFGPGVSSPRIGYVFQNPRLLPWRTVRENIDLVLPQGAVDSARVDHLLDVLGVRSVQHQHPERLSLGMSRRVAIARAFAIQPDLLLMDEPFVSLDAPTARKARQLLLKVWTERRHTVLFVTHDVREAILLADRLVFLSEAPARVILETRVEIPRPERDREEVIETYRKRLLDEFPALARLL